MAAPELLPRIYASGHTPSWYATPITVGRCLCAASRYNLKLVSSVLKCSKGRPLAAAESFGIQQKLKCVCRALPLPSWTFFVWLPCDMHTHETLGKNSKQTDGHDTPRKLDAYATDAYYCIICFLHIICVQSAKIYAYLHCNINMHTLYFLCACYK